MHPDKLCDRISDAILDECLRQDPNSRVAVETMGGHGIITITGEVTTKGYFNAREIAQRIAGKQYGVQVNIVQQSPEISQGVDTGGAGDQGIMVGYACNETPELMPLEVMLARSLNQYIYKHYPFDGKTQVTVEDGEIKSIVASFQNVSTRQLQDLIIDWVDKYDRGFLIRYKADETFRNVPIYCNPAGDWDIGGFEADTGLTGRKLMVDNYGPRVPIGGGCFSGKDSTKVDRSAAYMARRIAVDILKDKKASEVFVYLAYAIGKAEPLQATAIVDGLQITIDWLDLRPNSIINNLKLKEPQFEKNAEWGHFGNGFSWDI
jgi:S-adenosylmethionine synthetase